MSQQPGEDLNYGMPAAPSDYRQPAGYGYPEAGSPGSQHAPNPGAAPNVGNYGDYGYGQGGTYQPSYGYGDYGSDRTAEHGHDPDSYRQLSASLILDDGSNRHLQLTEGTTVVGRGQDAQFRLPDTGVSRRHLEITWDGHSARLADLGSTNGTTVNGNPVQTWQLVDGDVVRIGQSRLVFRTGA